ncbi:MAG TPA: UbiH/UbiF/VisC/COQ6 family ubiquinone biosynthesis hydroxylase [Solimonas sp.]
MSATRCDVAIVGGGLVGVATALALHRQGWHVRLFERGAGPKPLADYDARVYAISPATQRFLAQLDVWSAAAAQRVSPYARMQVWEDDPATGLAFDAADIRAAVLGHIVENEVLLTALWRALPEAVIEAGAVVTEVATTPDQASLQLADGRAFEARLLVIAEGRDSPLRERLGFEVTAGDYPQTAVVCHVQTEAPHRETCWQRFLHTGPLALLPLADGRSSIVWSTADAERLLALDDAAFCLQLGAASQHVLGRILATTPRLRFGLGLRHADAYVGTRAVLIGDAAHVVHPLAGQGVNLGFADAEALARVLGDAPGRDPGGLRLLKRYERQRRADVLDMLAVTDALYRAYALDLPGLPALRMLGMRAVNAVPPLRQALIRRAAGLH